MQAYIKYKAFYDKKANASKLKKADYVFIPQPKADHQGSKIPFTDFRWIGPYIIEKVLPNNKYWYAKSALTRRKSFIEWGCDNSEPANSYQTYQPHNASGNQTRKLSLHTMIYTPGRGNVNMTSRYLTAITTNCQSTRDHNRIRADSWRNDEHSGNQTRKFPRKNSSARRITWWKRRGSRHAAWCGYEFRATWPHAYQPPQLKIRSPS